MIRFLLVPCGRSLAVAAGLQFEKEPCEGSVRPTWDSISPHEVRSPKTWAAQFAAFGEWQVLRAQLWFYRWPSKM